MGMYAIPEIHDWFVSEFPKHSHRKLDMGKNCIRFKKDLSTPPEVTKVTGVSSSLSTSLKTSSVENLPEAFQYLIEAENVLLTPHVAGWTVESKEKLAQTIVDKIKAKFC